MSVTSKAQMEDQLVNLEENLDIISFIENYIDGPTAEVRGDELILECLGSFFNEKIDAEL